MLREENSNHRFPPSYFRLSRKDKKKYLYVKFVDFAAEGSCMHSFSVIKSNFQSIIFLVLLVSDLGKYRRIRDDKRVARRFVRIPREQRGYERGCWGNLGMVAELRRVARTITRCKRGTNPMGGRWESVERRGRSTVHQGRSRALGKREPRHIELFVTSLELLGRMKNRRNDSPR